MSRAFGKTTKWVNDNFDKTEWLLQSGYNLYLNHLRANPDDNNSQDTG